MKKRYMISGLLIIALLFGLGWSHYLWGLWGTWQADDSLDVLGDSPLDGTVTLAFSPNGTGTGVSAHGEAAFNYRVYHRDMLFSEVENGLTHAMYYDLEGKTLTLVMNQTEIIYTRQ